MKIGELARLTGTPVETIRHYEREGLLPAPARTEANYRVYGVPQAERLAFIRHCRALDMSLEEVRVLLRLRDTPQADCGDANALLDAHIGHVSARIRALRQLERQLRALRAQCGEVRSAQACGILGALAAEAAPAAPAAGAGRTAQGRHVGGTHAPRPGFRPAAAARTPRR